MSLQNVIIIIIYVFIAVVGVVVVHFFVRHVVSSMFYRGIGEQCILTTNI